MISWLPVLIMFLIAIGFALASLGVSYLLSPKNPTTEKLAPYECGIFPEEEPSQRFPVKFYMVAMLYIVFDIEIIFLLAWATRFNQLGWYGILVISIFTFFVLETLYYVWKTQTLCFLQLRLLFILLQLLNYYNHQITAMVLCVTKYIYRKTGNK